VKIENVKIENFKGIESLGADLGGRSVFVTGGNASGKTSFISAIYCALTGKNMPPNPIKGTARTAKIEVEIDDFAVELEFKKKGKKIEKKLSLYSKVDGEKIESPRARLDQIIGTLEFDPFEFMRMQPTPQLNYFCKVFGIEGIDALNMDIQEINEVVAYEKKRLVSTSGQYKHFDPKTAELEIQSLSKLNEQYLESCAFNRLTAEVTEKAMIKVEQIESLKLELATLESEVKAGEVWLAKREQKDEAILKVKLENLEETNEEIKQAQENKTLSDEIVKIESTLETAKTEKAAKISEKKALISSHTKAINGFDYDDALGFTLDGLPFHVDQNNTAAQIVAGLKLGAGLLGDLKIARFDGSLLDQESLDSVSKFAEAEGLQLFVELVDRNEKDLRLEFVEDSENETPKK